MRKRLHAIVQDTFFRHNVVFFVGSIIVAFLNYLYHPVMSRMMSVEDFGEAQALFSVFAQVSIPLLIFSIIALNLYTNKHTYESPVVRQFSLLTFYVGCAIALALFIGSPFLVSSLKLNSVWELYIIAGTILVSSLSVFGKAYLQASHRFTHTSIANALNAGGKLLSGVVLVYLGFAVTGAIGALLIASLATFLYIKKHAKRYLVLPHFTKLSITPELTHELRFGVIVLFGTGLITFFSTADIIFAKYLFTPETAGVYAGISVVGRIIFFATASIAGVLLSHIRLTESLEVNRRILRQGLILTALIGGAGLAVFALVPELVVSLLVGGDYSSQSQYLPLLALNIFIVSLINICVNYAIALREKYVIIIGILGIVVSFLLVLLLPATPYGLIVSFLGGSVITFMLFIYSIYVNKSTGRASNPTQTVPYEPQTRTNKEAPETYQYCGTCAQ